jgi:hypothetical protein
MIAASSKARGCVQDGGDQPAAPGIFNVGQANGHVHEKPCHDSREQRIRSDGDHQRREQDLVHDLQGDHHSEHA